MRSRLERLSSKVVIVGAQWGDEGKGKIVDLLSADYDVTVRYQGGSNAGHTVILGKEKFILHLLPTGILQENTKGIVAQGMVIDLEVLVKEIKSIEEKGRNIRERLLISNRAHLVLPYHKLLDRLFEKKGGIGTTLRGIGPAYMFKYGRKGIRVGDLEDKDRFYKLLKENIEFTKELCEKVYCETFDLDIDSIYTNTLEYYSEIKEMVADVSAYMLETKESILFEGAQGTMLDIDMGTYPFVTSSNSSALGLTNGTGLPPSYFSDAFIVGVSKAYTTRVGEGPFPTELFGESADRMREWGGEYGSTTGRPRRCGWLDLVALKHAVRVNGLNGIIITKLDVLDNLEEIKVCIAYECKGRRIDYFPATLSELEECKPVYKSFKGWLKNTRGLKDPEGLPELAVDYIRFIEDYTGVPIILLSTGPEREEYINLYERVKS